MMVLQDDVLKQTVEAYEKHGFNQNATARSLGIARSTLQVRLSLATAKGIGSTLSQRPLPEGSALQGTTTLYDAAGSPRLQWVKARVETVEQTIAGIKGAFADWDLAKKPTPKHPQNSSNGITLYPIADLHFGMYAWKEETGDDYDTDIAQHSLLDNLSTLVGRSPKTETAIILNLGDFFHSDNDEQKTRHSGVKLDVDTRYARVLREGVQLMLDATALAKKRHRYVMVKNIPGNHDPYGSLALTTAMAAYFADDPDVIVDTEAAPIWTHLYHQTLLVAMHGDMAKPQELPGIAAARWPELWGEAKWRYGYTGHIHQRRVLKADAFERGGMEVEVLRTIAPKDAWSTQMGHTARRSLVSITHSGTYGEVSRQTVNVA